MTCIVTFSFTISNYIAHIILICIWAFDIYRSRETRLIESYVTKISNCYSQFQIIPEKSYGNENNGRLDQLLISLTQCNFYVCVLCCFSAGYPHSTKAGAIEFMQLSLKTYCVCKRVPFSLALSDLVSKSEKANTAISK